MARDQAASPQQQKAPQAVPHPRDVEHVLKSLPVQRVPGKASENAEFLKDAVAHDEDQSITQGDDPGAQAFLTALTWIAYAAAIAAAILLTWSSGAGVVSYLPKP